MQEGGQSVWDTECTALLTPLRSQGMAPTGYDPHTIQREGLKHKHHFCAVITSIVRSQPLRQIEHYLLAALQLHTCHHPVRDVHCHVRTVHQGQRFDLLSEGNGGLFAVEDLHSVGKDGARVGVWRQRYRQGGAILAIVDPGGVKTTRVEHVG